MWLAGLRLVLTMLAIGMMHHAAAARIVVCVESVDRAAHAEWGASCSDDEIHPGGRAACDAPSLVAPEGCVHRPADLAEFRERSARPVNAPPTILPSCTHAPGVLTMLLSGPRMAGPASAPRRSAWTAPAPRPMTVIVQV